jgi:hypothetical protein
MQCTLTDVDGLQSRKLFHVPFYKVGEARNKLSALASRAFKTPGGFGRL